MRISGNVSDKCQFFACRIDNREQNLSCALYTLKIGEINDEEKGEKLLIQMHNVKTMVQILFNFVWCCYI